MPEDQMVNQGQAGGQSPGAMAGLQDEERRQAIFRLVSIISLVGLGLISVAYVVLWMTTPTFPILPLLVVNGYAFAFTLISLWVWRRWGLDPAITVYFVGITLAFLTAVYFLGGVRGPLTQAYVAVLLFSGLLGGRKITVMSAVGFGLLTIVMALLEYFDILSPPSLSDTVSQILFLLVLILSLGATVVLTAQFFRMNERAMAALEERTTSLLDAYAQAETAVETSFEARQAAQDTAEQLRLAAQDYAQVLERVAGGDYTARIELEEEAQAGLSEELLQLGAYLNQTVDNLVGAVEESQQAQRIYIEQTWEAFRDAGEVPMGYRYRHTEDLDDGGVEIDEGAWLAAMAQAVQDKSVVVNEDGELALPLDLRGELIGALGLRREGGGWHQEDVQLIQDISDQLAQTLDRLQLLDDVSRRAAMQRTIGDITSRVRAEVEIEMVVERALAELGRALDAERGTALLTLSGDSAHPAGSDRPDIEEDSDL